MRLHVVDAPLSFPNFTLGIFGDLKLLAASLNFISAAVTTRLRFGEELETSGLRQARKSGLRVLKLPDVLFSLRRINAEKSQEVSVCPQVGKVTVGAIDCHGKPTTLPGCSGPSAVISIRR